MPAVTRIIVPTPPIGGKIWLLDQKGIFVLEEGPAVLRTIACTHAGSGAISVFDGLPNEEGLFPDFDMSEEHENYEQRNGREIYRAHPVVMGSWMCDGGCFWGLTLVVRGGHESVSPTASVVWMPHGRVRV